MQKTVYNPQKGRLETIDINLTDNNTTWFDDADTGVSLIADVEGGLLIAGSPHSYPVLLYGVSRSDINHDRLKAEELKHRHTTL
jgi:hypothetical protein